MCNNVLDSGADEQKETCTGQILSLQIPYAAMCRDVHKCASPDQHMQKQKGACGNVCHRTARVWKVIAAPDDWMAQKCYDCHLISMQNPCISCCDEIHNDCSQPQ